MKRANGTFCDKCQLAITEDQERRGEALHYHKTDYHCSCYLQHRRENPRAVFVTALLFALLIVISFNANADEPVQLNEKGFKKGCVCTGVNSAGDKSYEKVLVVAQNPGGGDYWVFYPDYREERHRRSNGSLIALRLPTEQFIPDHKFRTSRRGKIQCPPHFWNQAPVQTAER